MNDATSETRPNLCPACGSVAAGDSSRYCVRHLRAMLLAARASLRGAPVAYPSR